MMLLLGMIVTVCLLSACSSSAINQNNSFAVYTKNDGIYYTYLNGEEKKEQKIQAGEEFECPMISEDGEFVAYQKGKELYLYSISTINTKNLQRWSLN